MNWHDNHVSGPDAESLERELRARDTLKQSWVALVKE